MKIESKKYLWLYGQASFASLEDKGVLIALLQECDEGQEASLDLDEQPQGSTNAYESKSGGIIATMQDMQEKAEASRAESQKEEMNAAHNFAMLKQALESEIASLKAFFNDFDDLSGVL